MRIIKQNKYGYLIIGLISLVVLIFYFKSTNTKNNLPSGLSIKSRIFKNEILEKQSDFNCLGKIIRVYKYNGFLWYIDAHSQNIYQIDKSGKIVNKLGAAKGEAPWENSSIWYFDNDDSESSYFVIDKTKNMFKKFSKANQLEYYYKSNRTISNGVKLNGDLFLYTEDTGTDFNFITSDIKSKSNNSSVTIKDLIKKEYGHFPNKNLDLVFEGNFTRNNNKGAIYYCYKAGLFFYFDDKGGIKYYSKTIDNFPVPKPISKELMPGTFEETVEPDVFVNYSACLDKNNIYILSNILDQANGKTRIVDIYNILDGKYKFSISLPTLSDTQKPTEICIADDNILTVMYENLTFVNYKLVL